MARIRRRFGRITASFDAAEARLLHTLVGEVADLVAERDRQVQGTSAPAGTSTPDRTAQEDAGGTEQRDPLAELVGMDLNWEEAAGELSEEGTGTGPGRPEDPALARLFPDAYGDNDEAASEFRRITESSLREGKLATARTVLATLPTDGGSIRLDEETAQAWLSALNDVRLALGTRLGVTDDTDLDVDPADPANRLLTVYLWVGAVQQQLVDAVTGTTSPF